MYSSHNPNSNPNKEGDGLTIIIIIVVVIVISVFLEKKTKAQRDQVITWNHLGSMWWSQDLNPEVLVEKSVHSLLLYSAIQYKKERNVNII